MEMSKETIFKTAGSKTEEFIQEISTPDTCETEQEIKQTGEPGKEKIQTHRVGSITFGIMLIVFGGLFLLHLFLPVIRYEIIFHLWPCVLISLGIETLLSVRMTGTFVFDKTAIFLMIIVLFFAMGMGGMDMLFEYYEKYAIIG